MSEIKFRAWHKGNEEMALVKTIDFIREVATLGYFSGRKNNGTKFEWLELMQYTGLKDKNGVEGFADDIVKAGKDELFKIGWFEDTASWILTGLETGKVRWIECRENFCLNDFQINFNECEVIGNIYENPELLNK